MKILAVDDEAKILRLLQFNLELEGFEIIIELDPTRVLDLAVEIKPDVILMDVMMPGINGYELTRLLRENPNTLDIPIIILTAKTHYAEILKAYNNFQIDYYITKPFTVEQVTKGIEMMFQ